MDAVMDTAADMDMAVDTDMAAVTPEAMRVLVTLAALTAVVTPEAVMPGAVADTPEGAAADMPGPVGSHTAAAASAGMPVVAAMVVAADAGNHIQLI
jgi:hypothetical protein